MANEEKKLVEIENLRKYFPIKGTNGPGVQAVQDVSLYIKKGETLGLVGESPDAVKQLWEEPFSDCMSRPVVRLSMTVRQFLTIRWTKTANHLAKRNL